jgi:hypothetical protein
MLISISKYSTSTKIFSHALMLSGLAALASKSSLDTAPRARQHEGFMFGAKNARNGED